MRCSVKTYPDNSDNTICELMPENKNMPAAAPQKNRIAREIQRGDPSARVRGNSTMIAAASGMSGNPYASAIVNTGEETVWRLPHRRNASNANAALIASTAPPVMRSHTRVVISL